MLEITNVVGVVCMEKLRCVMLPVTPNILWRKLMKLQCLRHPPVP